MYRLVRLISPGRRTSPDQVAQPLIGEEHPETKSILKSQVTQLSERHNPGSQVDKIRVRYRHGARHQQTTAATISGHSSPVPNPSEHRSFSGVEAWQNLH